MTAQLIGFVGQEAERLSCLLQRLVSVPWLEAADGIQPWGVGQYMDGETILRNQPGRLKGDLAFADLLSPRTDSPMFIARASPPSSPFEDVQPFRFGRWLIALQGEICLDDQRALQAVVLPPFLQRACRSQRQTELLFLNLIAHLHEKRFLTGGSGDDLPAIALTLGYLTEVVTSPTNLLATNGEALFAYCAAMPLYYCMFSGIEDCAPCRIGNGYTRLPAIVEEHHRFRAVCVSSRPFETEEVWQEIPTGKVLVVDRDVRTQLVSIGG